MHLKWARGFLLIHTACVAPFPPGLTSLFYFLELPPKQTFCTHGKKKKEHVFYMRNPISQLFYINRILIRSSNRKRRILETMCESSAVSILRFWGAPVTWMMLSSRIYKCQSSKSLTQPVTCWTKDTPGNQNDLPLPSQSRLKSLMPWTDFDKGNGAGVLALFLLRGVITLKALIFVYHDKFFKYIALRTQQFWHAPFLFSRPGITHTKRKHEHLSLERHNLKL